MESTVNDKKDCSVGLSKYVLPIKMLNQKDSGVNLISTINCFVSGMISNSDVTGVMIDLFHDFNKDDWDNEAIVNFLKTLQMRTNSSQAHLGFEFLYPVPSRDRGIRYFPCKLDCSAKGSRVKFSLNISMELPAYFYVGEKLFSTVGVVKVSVHFDSVGGVFVDEIVELIEGSVRKFYSDVDWSCDSRVGVFTDSISNDLNKSERIIDYSISCEHFSHELGFNVVKNISKGIVGGIRVGS
jgi:hypothetical protein